MSEPLSDRGSVGCGWAFCKLTTIGEASRAMLRETLRQTLTWAVDQIVNKSHKHQEVLVKLGLS